MRVGCWQAEQAVNPYSERHIRELPVVEEAHWRIEEVEW